jgi:hypothetical protein
MNLPPLFQEFDDPLMGNRRTPALQAAVHSIGAEYRVQYGFFGRFDGGLVDGVDVRVGDTLELNELISQQRRAWGSVRGTECDYNFATGRCGM